VIRTAICCYTVEYIDGGGGGGEGENAIV